MLFIKGKFEVKKETLKETLVKEDPVKVIEAKETLVKEDKAKAIKKLSNKLDNIEEKADEVFEKVKKKTNSPSCMSSIAMMQKFQNIY